ncbi:MAG TPA: hypothetical protein VJ961_04520 [Mariprofundaceae bacterium]|nr:hypothetical protein [Mariprofundaceae bacterium]
MRLRIVAIILLLVAVAGWAVWRGVQPSGAPQASLPEWPAIHSAVDRVEIRPPSGATVRLEKKDGKWMLMRDKPVAANDKFVEHLIDDLVNAHVIRVVSRNRDHDEALQVGQQGVSVRLFGQDGKPLLDLVVGKQGNDLLSTYVRRVGKPETVAVDKALVWQVRRGISSWKAPKENTEKKGHVGH